MPSLSFLSFLHLSAKYQERVSGKRPENFHNFPKNSHYLRNFCFHLPLLRVQSNRKILIVDVHTEVSDEMILPQKTLLLHTLLLYGIHFLPGGKDLEVFPFSSFLQVAYQWKSV